MHIFITGLPGSGKTTLIKKIIPYLKNPCGFFTEELRERGERIGFKIKSLDGGEGILAHRNFKSSLKVSGYGLDLSVLEKILKKVKQQLENTQTVVIDEIGKMEWASSAFREFIDELLDSGKRIIGVISEKGKDFDYIKKRGDVLVFRLDKRNFKGVFNKIILAKDALSQEELRHLDKKAKEILGLSENLLIENASRASLEALDEEGISPKRVAIFSGRGNNSADSLALGRHLINRNIDIEAFLALNNKPYNKEVEFQVNILKKILSTKKIKALNTIEEVLSLRERLSSFDLIVDGIFGIGFRPPLGAFYKELIRLINETSRSILAIDIPSGLPADSVDVDEVAIKASFTVTFLAPKISFFLENADQYTGEVIVKDIGVSRDVLEGL